MTLSQHGPGTWGPTLVGVLMILVMGFLVYLFLEVLVINQNGQFPIVNYVQDGAISLSLLLALGWLLSTHRKRKALEISSTSGPSGTASNGR